MKINTLSCLNLLHWRSPLCIDYWAESDSSYDTCDHTISVVYLDFTPVTLILISVLHVWVFQNKSHFEMPFHLPDNKGEIFCCPCTCRSQCSSVMCVLTPVLSLPQVPAAPTMQSQWWKRWTLASPSTTWQEERAATLGKAELPAGKCL